MDLCVKRLTMRGTEASIDECFISTNKDSELTVVTTKESLPADSPEPSQIPSTVAAPRTTRSGHIVMFNTYQVQVLSLNYNFEHVINVEHVHLNTVVDQDCLVKFCKLSSHSVKMLCTRIPVSQNNGFPG